MRFIRKVLLPLILLVSSAVISSAKEIPKTPEALANYIGLADPGFAWSLEDSREERGTGFWRFKLTSQVWHGISWTHDLLLVMPAGVPSGKVLLLNEGGAVSRENIHLATTLAAKIQAPVAILFGVPNQPLFEGKKEDDLIAETFIRYIDTGDSSWPLLFPMVKSVVKAMDTLQEFSREEWGDPVEKFIIGGTSKRGWTTWLTAASDPRVMAITPMVIDVLNMRVQLAHQQRSLGGPSDEISPYTKRGLIPIADTPRADRLWSMVDPWTYRDRFTMPKLIVLGNNDPFWSTDALNLYWDGLPGEKYISYTPNAGHDLVERDASGTKVDAARAVDNVCAFIRYQLAGRSLPKLGWKHTPTTNGDHLLTVTADPAPRQARLWTARSATRDFRQARWESRSIELPSGEPITASLAKPATGFTASYVDLSYQIDNISHWLCTQLYITESDKEEEQGGH